MAEKKPRINIVIAIILLLVAIVFDLVQAGISLVGGVAAGTGVGVVLTAAAAVGTPMLTILAGLTFWLWFRLLKVKYNSPKKALFFGGSTLIEFIPFLNALPTWTALVVGTIVISLYEDIAEKQIQENKDTGYTGKQ